MRKLDLVLIFGSVPAGLILLSVGAYFLFDQETMTLTDEVRQKVPGSFLQLPDGVVHYELAGPPPAGMSTSALEQVGSGPQAGPPPTRTDVRTVVLVHGFSVPYYIWDPTFEALIEAGFRVLRYDLYG